MKILVANDDGIKAEGLNVLVKHLAKVGEVFVVAPDSQRSGASHSITMNKKLYFAEEKVDGATKAYSFTGTPADCVKLGLELLKNDGIEIDYVLSGINHGGNLGTDTLYSGTVGAAREGLINGKMSIAVSVNSHEPKHGFEYAAKLAADTVSKLEAVKRDEVICMLNINAPDLPAEDIKGLKVTKLGIRDYADWFNPIACEDGKIEICYGGEPVSFDEESSGRCEMADVIAMDLGYATITPLNYDLTCSKTLDNNIGGIF